MAALPFVSVLSESIKASDRATFVRIFYDFARHCRELAQPIPDNWRQALADCLANARPKERGEYFVVLVEIVMDEGFDADGRNRIAARSGGDVSRQDTPQAELVGVDPVSATHDDIESVLGAGSIDDIMVLVSDGRVIWNARLTTIIVNRARTALNSDNDPRLAEAILAVRPTRIETAPLFLEANVAQRWAIALAAQRAELGRHRNGAIAAVAREIINQLEYAAIADDASDFSDLLGRTINAPSRLAKRIAQDPTGEPLAIALIAIGAPNDVCVRILTARDIYDRSRFRRILPLTRLSKSLSPLAARRIVSAIIGSRGPADAEAIGPLRISTQRQNNQGTSHMESVSNRSKWSYPRNVSTVGAK